MARASRVDDPVSGARMTWTRRHAAYGWAAAAAVFVVAGGLLAWNLVLLRGGDNDVQRFAQLASIQYMRSAAGGADAAMVRFGDDDRAVVVFDRPPLDASKAYQVWRIVDGRPLSIGLAHNDASGHVAAVVRFDPTASGSIAVTIEPATGSDQPTTSPIFQTG